MPWRPHVSDRRIDGDSTILPGSTPPGKWIDRNPQTAEDLLAKSAADCLGFLSLIDGVLQAVDFACPFRGQFGLHAFKFRENGFGYVYWADQCHMNGVFFSFTEKDEDGNPISGTIVMQRCRL